ncbi:MAG: chromosomal replication initiator protein DnaA, partial [Hyphomicrobiales bacterium]
TEIAKPAARGPGIMDVPAASHASHPALERTADFSARDRHHNGTSFGSPLDNRYVFDTFVEGTSNRVALAAAKAIAENGPQSVRFNPLFVHANVGLGKTHLLQAIANAATRRADQPRVVYLTAEYFMWRFATAIRDNQALDFKENLRGIDILIIDDMQFLQGKSIQQEFCHLLNALIDSARQVIVAADRPAFELESLDARVRSRLSGGVAIEMVSPDFDMRKEILTTRVDALKVEDPSFLIDEKVVDTIARRVIGSGRDLEGAFNQIAFRHAVGQPLSADHLDDLLNSLTRTNGEKRIRIEDILKFVSRHYNVTRTDILSARRTRTIVRPRQIAMYLAKTMTPRSLPEIGRRFGGRDHTTVLHAVRKIEGERAKDEKLGEELDLIRRMIEE